MFNYLVLHSVNCFLLLYFFVLYLQLRLNGYANAYSMKDITENELDEIEAFVKTELDKRLQEKCTRSNTEMSQLDKENFFGLYASSADEFKLLRGERKLLLKIASFLTDLYEKDAEMFKSYCEVPKRFKIKNDVANGPVGLFYGKKRHKQMNYAENDSNVLILQLFAKLKPFFESFENLKPVRSITQDIIKIVDLKDGYRADVICVFCPSNDCGIDALLKRIVVQWDGHWNLTNFKKHIQKMHSKENPLISSKSVENSFTHADHNYSILKFDESNSPSNHTKNESAIFVKTEVTHSTLNTDINVSDIMDLPIEIDDSSAMTNNLRSVVYDQFSNQNIRLIELVFRMNEAKKHMSIKIDGQPHNLDVLKIPGDGNCLFAAFVHQIHLVKLNSTEHKVFTTELRQKVVNHIKQNLESYVRAIKGRLQEKSELATKSPDYTIAECESFIEELAKPNFWGGAETIRAVSEIHKVNVVAFNEKGDFYFPCGFNETYDRSVFLAYRLGPKTTKSCRLIHNHYDSVCTINEKILYKCSTILADKIQGSNSASLVCDA